MPLQQLPLQMCQLVPLAITKGFLSKHVFGDEPLRWKHTCQNEECLINLTIDGTEIAVTRAVAAWVSIFLVLLTLWTIDVVIRAAVTRYRPRALWCCFTAFLQPLIATPFRMYVQFWAMHDFCWGSAKFICTERSSVSGGMVPKGCVDPEDLRKPLLENGSSITVSTMASSSKSSSLSSLGGSNSDVSS